MYYNLTTKLPWTKQHWTKHCKRKWTHWKINKTRIQNKMRFMWHSDSYRALFSGFMILRRSVPNFVFFSSSYIGFFSLTVVQTRVHIYGRQTKRTAITNICVYACYLPTFNIHSSRRCFVFDYVEQIVFRNFHLLHLVNSISQYRFAHKPLNGKIKNANQTEEKWKSFQWIIIVNIPVGTMFQSLVHCFMRNLCMKWI